MAAQNFFPIVVAIIAVLVAIAVPLFVGALNDAEDRVIDANERSLKGMAVTQLLTNPPKDLRDTAGKLDTTTTKWYAVGECDKNGKITLNNITKTAPTDEGKTESAKTADGYYLVSEIDVSDLMNLKPDGTAVTP